MKKQIADRWVKALRSGKYKQGKEALHWTNGEDTFCCLGVLCELYQESAMRSKGMEKMATAKYSKKVEYDSECGTLPKRVMLWAKIKTGSAQYRENLLWESLVIQNDDDKSFTSIADIIEQNYEAL